MAMVQESGSTTVLLVSKPFLLAKVTCLFGIRSTCIVILTWIELLRAGICFQLKLLWTMIIWTIAILSLPVRALNALQREKMLEVRILELQTELESMSWHQKKLEERLQMAIRERGLLEELLVELEDENDDVIRKMEVLEAEVRDLRTEKVRLEGVHSEASGCKRCKAERHMGGANIAQNAEKFSLLKCDYNEKEVEGKIALSKTEPELSDIKEETRESGGLTQPFSLDVIEQWRGVALSRSFFSAILSLSVGIIAWKAKDPCMPLVAALFGVVIISLGSVLRFFSSVQVKPGNETVALLSLNWFILGILTYPTLPRVADELAPLLHKAAEETVKWWFGGFVV
ncbi:OLC1v1030778C1 [Oldenlandia corymbosa var. corymbosa]|uniref:OLC1v1030778C1 n=1 Tax=Oldenlandia corymbosa var. corymbosa TaxID=529605 RepID=A0AAV1CHP0_OLDCO|nr:OLC1v1030778C1 [Oldenlandia corymbosa var. corymbosa]